MGRTAYAYPLESKRLYSFKEFEVLDLPDDGYKYELIDGELKASPPNGYQNGLIRANLVKATVLFDPDEKFGLVIQSVGFMAAPGFGPIPGVAYILASHVPPSDTKGLVPFPPDLAVEVWSPYNLSTRKHQNEARAKIRRYQVAGVPIVWAINPANKTVEVYHPDQTGPVQVLGVEGELSGEDVIPGFTMPVKALFE